MRNSVYIRVYDLDETPIITLSRQERGEPVNIAPLFANPEIYQGQYLDVTSFVHYLLNSGFKIEANSNPDICDYLYELSHTSGTRWEDSGDAVRLAVSRRIYSRENGMAQGDAVESLYEGHLNNIDWPKLDEKANAPQFDEPVRFLVEIQCNHSQTKLTQLIKTIRSALALSFIHKVTVEQFHMPGDDDAEDA